MHKILLLVYNYLHGLTHDDITLQDSNNICDDKLLLV